MRANYYAQQDWSPPRTKKLSEDSAEVETTLVMDANRVSRPDGDTYLIMVQFQFKNAWVSNYQYFLTADDARSLLAFSRGLVAKERAKSDPVHGALIQWRGRMLMDTFGEKFEVMSITYHYDGKFASTTVPASTMTADHLAAICELMPDVLRDLDALKGAPRSPKP